MYENICFKQGNCECFVAGASMKYSTHFSSLSRKRLILDVSVGLHCFGISTEGLLYLMKSYIRLCDTQFRRVTCLCHKANLKLGRCSNFQLRLKEGSETLFLRPKCVASYLMGYLLYSSFSSQFIKYSV